MTAPSSIRRKKSMLYRWFGPNRGTHWNIAGSVAVIILGSYLIYNNRDRALTTAAPVSAVEPTPALMAPAPPAPRGSEK
jgi:hypothetical protein